MATKGDMLPGVKVGAPLEVSPTGPGEDNEVIAIAACLGALHGLDGKAAGRVICYLACRVSALAVAPKRVTSLLGENAPGGIDDARGQHDGSHDGEALR